MSERQEVWITGTGLVSALGEGLDQHWDKLMAGEPLEIVHRGDVLVLKIGDPQLLPLSSPAA